MRPMARRRSSCEATYNRPVLLKGSRAFNARLVDTGRLVNVIGAAVALDLPHLLGLRARVVGSEVLDNVILDERILRPPV